MQILYVARIELVWGLEATSSRTKCSWNGRVFTFAINFQRKFNFKKKNVCLGQTHLLDPAYELPCLNSPVQELTLPNKVRTRPVTNYHWPNGFGNGQKSKHHQMSSQILRFLWDQFQRNDRSQIMSHELPFNQITFQKSNFSKRQFQY